MVVEWAHRGPYPRTHPQCVHTMLMLAPADAPLRCGRMGQTPIYDQVRGERINADVPAVGATCNRLVTTATPPASRHAGSGDGVWATGCRRWPCPEPPTSGVDIPCGSASSRRAIGGHSVGTASGPAPRSPYAASAQTRRQQPPEVRSRLQPSSPGRGGKGSQCSHRRRRRSATGKAHRTSSRGASRNPVFVVQCRSRRR